MKHPLGKVATIRNGYPFRGRITDDPAGDIGVLAMKDVQRDRSPTDADLPKMQAGDLKGIDKYRLQVGDVAFQSRGYKNDACVISTPLQAVASQGVYLIRPDTKLVSGAYLAWYLNHDNCQRRIQNLAQGTQMPLIPVREFADLLIDVPTSEVQAQIVQLSDARQQQKQLQAALDATTDQLINALCWQKLK